MDEMPDTQQLRRLSGEQRQRLLRELAEIEREAALGSGSRWKWDALLVAIAGACLGLAAWTGYLAVSLPHWYRTGGWRGAWVGFDVALLAAFAVTGWAAWRRRQILIASLLVLSTLLGCDAWFDVVLDVRTAGFWGSLAMALGIELPLAVLAIATARRLLRLTIGRVMRYEGLDGPVPPLWRIPLLGPAPGTPLRRLIRARGAGEVSAAAPSGRRRSAGG